MRNSPEEEEEDDGVVVVPEERTGIRVRKTADLQRLRLEKLMKNPEKEVYIPEKPKPREFPPPPDFVRNVMGSSAGAGSGEFHVYRHIRRREYGRQKYIQEMARKELKDKEYHDKLEENKRKAEEKTAKKRAKRLKRKAKLKSKDSTTSKSEQDDSDLSCSDAEVLQDIENEMVNDHNDDVITCGPKEQVLNKDDDESNSLFKENNKVS